MPASGIRRQGLLELSYLGSHDVLPVVKNSMDAGIHTPFQARVLRF
jgi:hypothetical protein